MSQSTPKRWDLAEQAPTSGAYLDMHNGNHDPPKNPYPTQEPGQLPPLPPEPSEPPQPNPIPIDVPPDEKQRESQSRQFEDVVSLMRPLR